MDGWLDDDNDNGWMEQKSEIQAAVAPNGEWRATRLGCRVGLLPGAVAFARDKADRTGQAHAHAAE